MRLEERLGYVHKGVEGLMAGAELERGAQIVGRISGDSTVAYAWAFARAVEAALAWAPPPRAVLLRGVMAELERLSHHINDVGAICNDASVLTIHARCTLQREDVLSVADACFGHRLMMDRVVPGGVAVDLSPEGVGRIRGLLARFEETRAEILRVYDSLPSLQDRTVTTGIVSPELVRQYAAGGFVGRASGRAFDARKAFPMRPTTGWTSTLKTRTAGDVDARLLVRMDEIEREPPDPCPAPGPAGAGRDQDDRPAVMAGEGAALVEAFRGDVFVSVRFGGGRPACARPCARRELVPVAAAGGRGRRQHRRRLPALQQIVQLLLLGPRSMRAYRSCSTPCARARPPITPPALRDAAALEEVARALGERARQRLGRSLAIREIDAGSCNGCELEIHAINNPVYDVERFGLKFVASPRHADVLLVTGPVTWNMREALLRTYNAAPEPKWVVALGDCATNCGVFAGSPAVVGPLAEILPVDLHVPGCPPAPLDDREGVCWR